MNGRGSARKQQLAQNNMTPKDQFRYSVLSAIHDEALSISDAIDQAYGEHVAGKDTQIQKLRARSAKLEQLLSEALRQGWLGREQDFTILVTGGARCGRQVSKEQANFAKMDIRTCGEPQLDALNDRAKVWREQHSPKSVRN